jgi:Domain of unknown function (DUF4340)
MIKKSTLVVLVCAIVLCGALYYYEKRTSSTTTIPEDKSKPAFTSVAADDITALTISHPGKTDQPPVQLSNHNGNWTITRPLDTSADQSAVRGIADGLASARVSGTEPAAPDRLKAYGLDSPRVDLDFQLKNGAKHKILMGDKDFTGISVYSLIDNAKTVSLLPISLYDSTDKPVNDLRDRGVLHIDSGKVASLELKNPKGDLALTKKTVKDQTQWDFTKPPDVRADDDNVSSLLSAVANGKFTSVENEKAENLAKYGLAHPEVTFTAVDDKGNRQTLEVGKKQGDGYLARNVSEPMVFLINDDLYKKLTQTFGELRDKNFVRVTENDVSAIELHNTNATMAIARKPGSDFDWVVQSPADVKGKSAATWKVFSPLTSAKAEEVIDHPSSEINSKLAKPAVEINFTEKSGTKLTVKISSAIGDFVYGQTSAGPTVYKLKKSILDDLNFKPSDLAS